MTENRSALEPALLTWVAETAGGTIVEVDRRPGGGRREAWIVDVETPDGTVLPLFLRYDRLDPAQRGDPFTLHREAHFYRAFEDSPVPVPRIVGVHPTEQAILSERVPGQAWFSRIRDEQERVAVASDFMRILAEMHRVDPRRLHLPDQHPDAGLRELVAHEIDVWETVYRGAGAKADPLIELALTWVKRNIPNVDGPVVIVQGDTGPGNFLYEDGRVTAVLDLELGHLGDPHDDLAWVTTRAVQEPFTDIHDRFADYERASGTTVDLDRVRYYRVLAELRIVILGQGGAVHPDPLSEVGNALAYGLLHRRLLVEALADVLGIELDTPADVDAESTEREWLYDAALDQLRHIIVPRSEDAFVIQRSKGLARILKYLRDADRYADRITERDVSDLEAALGSRPDTVADGTTVLVERHLAGEIPIGDVLNVFARQIAGRTQQMRSAMGVLAERHFDVL
ncbi:phosphotransferase family protein [Rhodococcus sp. NPDC047139]|uniref:phosphotransferase family protein n=1 Tax=Rhodococcus sp. NPDC047139 TaxID=3155141 RepID=UPI0033D9B283